MSHLASDIKKEVAEIKFFIHDLRVDSFINDVIHFHVTLNTDLEIYNIEQAQALHSDDLQELKKLAFSLRKARQVYSNSVRSFSPDRTIIAAGRKYIDLVQDLCELILNPLWGRFDKVISFLPEESRSVRSRNHYRNCLRWICGVDYRIEYFLQELDNTDMREAFDLGADVTTFTRDVLYGYVVEKSRSRVDIRLEHIDTAVVEGNKPRFRRMYFNLIMNAVDAMQEQRHGVIRINARTQGDRVRLSVSDNGPGMYPEKVESLLAERESLDGELHSLGFVFVKQTIADFNGELKIDAEIGRGTTILVSLPYFPDKPAPPVPVSRCSQYNVLPIGDDESPMTNLQTGSEGPGRATGPRDTSASRSQGDAFEANGRADTFERHANKREGRGQEDQTGAQTVRAPRDADKENACGQMIFGDYETSKATHPGCVFAIAVNRDEHIDFFAHRPYEQHWDISHEDLSPMLYEAVIRGRLEENEENTPELILKEPHNPTAYFDLKEIDVDKRNGRLFDQMVRDEYILSCRKLLNTGFPRHIRVHAVNAEKYLADCLEALGQEPFPIEEVARQSLSGA